MFTIHLSIVIFLPLVTGLIAAFAPRGLSRWVVLLGTVGVLAYWIAMVADFPTSGGDLKYVTQDKWIDELGISYALGVDGLNLLLIAIAFLMKRPAFPFHVWMPDGYRGAPIPALIEFSGVLSKVGSYGFHRT